MLSTFSLPLNKFLSIERPSAVLGFEENVIKIFANIRMMNFFLNKIDTLLTLKSIKTRILFS